MLKTRLVYLFYEKTPEEVKQKSPEITEILFSH